MILLGTLLLSNITITLPAEATVEGSEIQLGHIATVIGDDGEEVAKIQALELGYAPSPGFSRVLHAWKIEESIRRQFSDATLTMAGNDFCRVWPTVVEVRGSELQAKAKEELESLFAGRDANIRFTGSNEDVTVPKGVVGRELVVSRSGGKVNLRAGVWNVPVKIVVDSVPYRTVWLAFHVELYQSLPVLVRDIAADQSIGIDDIMLQRVILRDANLANALTSRKLAGAIAKRPLRQGEPVLPEDVKRIPAVTKGAVANLSVDNGRIRVMAKVVALQDGYLDDTIQVQVVGTNKELTAVVAQKGGLHLSLGTPMRRKPVPASSPARTR